MRLEHQKFIEKHQKWFVSTRIQHKNSAYWFSKLAHLRKNWICLLCCSLMKKCCFSSVCRKWSNPLTGSQSAKQRTAISSCCIRFMLSAWRGKSMGGRQTRAVARRSLCSSMPSRPQYTSPLPVFLLKRHLKGTSSCFLICWTTIRRTLYHDFSIKGGIEEGPSSLVFFEQGHPLGHHGWWKAFEVVMNFILFVWPQMGLFKKNKNNPSSVCLSGWRGRLLPPYTFYILPYFMCMHVKVTDWWMWLFSPSISRVQYSLYMSNSSTFL